MIEFSGHMYHKTQVAYEKFSTFHLVTSYAVLKLSL